MTRNYSNVVATNIVTSSTLNDSTTAVEVDDGTTLPAVDFAGRIDDEVLLVTGLSGGSSTGLTVERGYDGTTAAVHASGAGFDHVVIAKDLNEMPEWLRYLGGRQSDETAHAADDFFDNADHSPWTITTVAGTATWTELYGLLSVVATGGASGDSSTALKSIGALSAPVTIETAIKVGMWSTDYHAIRLIFADGTTSTDTYIGVGPANRSSGVSTIQVYTGTLGDTDVASKVVAGITSEHGAGRLYVRFVWQSSNTWAVSVSWDGISWTDLGLAPFSETMTPTHFGFMVTNFGGTNDLMAGFEYFRVYESDLDV